MNLIPFLWAKSKSLFICACIAGVASGAASSVVIALIYAAFKRQDAWIIASYFGACIARGAFSAISVHLFNLLTFNAIVNLWNRLSEKILNSSTRNLERVGKTRLFVSLTDDVYALVRLVAQIPNLCIQFTVVCGCLIYMGLVSYKAMALMMVFIALGASTFRMVQKRAVRALTDARNEKDSLWRHFATLIDGNKELKLHEKRRADFLSTALRPSAEYFRKEQLHAEILFNGAWTLGQGFYFLFIGVIAFTATDLFALSGEAIVGVVLTTLFMMGPLDGLISSLPDLFNAKVVFNRLLSIEYELDAGTEDGDGRKTVKNSRFSEIALQNVVFRYEDNGNELPFTLGPINLNLRPGEIVFIAGGNGSGKSTFGKVLTGLYPCTSGQILWDRKTVRLSNQNSYRQLFSTVFSDYYLFEQLWGIDNARCESHGDRYLTELQMREHVRLSDGRFSSIQLSQGQRKRLALVVARLEDRPIFLFDEWAADQDPQYKQVFYHTLLPRLKEEGKSVIVISHDDRYFDVADRLVHLTSGEMRAISSSAPCPDDDHTR